MADQVFAGFRGNIKPVRVSLAYRLGIVLVAMVMCLLPLAYVAIIGAAIALVGVHCVYDAGLLSGGYGLRGSLFLALLYFAPIAVGGILVAYMVRPLFVRAYVEGRTRSLTRQGEPLLFAFVERVCEAVDAPKPTRIVVDCNVNAAAQVQSGPLGLPIGKQYTLTIGVPLVAGLTVEQFGGVLAHELGHFTQGGGIRLTSLIYRVNAWFARVVYERSWDDHLARHAEDTDIRIALILGLAMLCVWITRGVLWLLMVTGHAVGGFMLRQMEYHADLHEIRLSGSKTFEATTRRMYALNVAFHKAFSDLVPAFTRGVLGDNLPRLLVENLNRLPVEKLRELNREVDKLQTGLFDSHPSPNDRIAQAQREEASGALSCALPASCLFQHYDALCRNITWDLYRGMFGNRLPPSVMQPIETVLANA